MGPLLAYLLLLLTINAQKGTLLSAHPELCKPLIRNGWKRSKGHAKIRA
jgi:hypothetical protein